MSYASAITHFREKANLSKRRLAEMIGVDQSYLTHLESGRRLPSIPTVERIAEAVGASPATVHARAYARKIGARTAAKKGAQPK